MRSTIVEIPSGVRADATEGPIGERQMWGAVLLLAVEDWRLGTLRRRREAQKFLFEEQDNFNRVCAAAGMEPGSFRARLLKLGNMIELQTRWQAPVAA